MGWLLGYLFLALGVSFICSLLEAILLSLTGSYIHKLRTSQPAAAARLHQLKQQIDRPLAAILTLNTIAHTVGAAGVGAESARLFGEIWMAPTSALLTLLILYLTEIVPKTLGATRWRQWAPHIGRPLLWLIRVLFPFIWLAERLAHRLGRPVNAAHYREEIAAMAELGRQAGELAAKESRIIQHLLHFAHLKVSHIMTPRTVLYRLSADLPLVDYLRLPTPPPFTRLPLFEGEVDNIIGYVHQQDLLLAAARGRAPSPLRHWLRPLFVVPATASLSSLFDSLLAQREPLALVVNEYGEVQGLVTMEDLVETMLGLEIVEQDDMAEDMQALARQLWRKRIQEHGISLHSD